MSFTWFAAADTGGQMQAAYAAINGYYDQVTGTKYFATANGVINVFGRGDRLFAGHHSRDSQRGRSVCLRPPIEI